MAQIKVYGADWCGLTKRSLRHLDELAVEYDYIDVDKDPQASEWVKQQNNGKEKKPTIDVAGEILTAPANSELDTALRNHNLLRS